MSDIRDALPQSKEFWVTHAGNYVEITLSPHNARLLLEAVRAFANEAATCSETLARVNGLEARIPNVIEKIAAKQAARKD